MGTQYKMNAITGELDLVENLEEINAALEKGILKSVDISGENMIFTFNTPDLSPVTVPLSHFATNLQGHAYIGLATPSTTPVTLKGNEKVFYIVTEEGIYSNFGVGNISELSIMKSDNGSWKAENSRLKFLSLTGGKMLGNIDMNGKRIDNIGIEEVDKLPTFNLYEGRMVRFKNKTYTFYNGLWLALSDDLRGRVNDTHEENFVYQPTAADLSVKDGFADIKKLKGNTLVWNQLSKPTLWSAGGGATATYDSTTGIHTLTTLESQYNKDLRIIKSFAANHKYLIKCAIKPDCDVNCSMLIYPSASVGESTFSLTNGIKTHVKIILHIPSTPQDSLRINIREYTAEAGKTLEIEDIQLFDLTQMFGTGNEPTIEEFEAMFPNDYYEYNEGELMSFNGKGLKSVGFNQFDKSTAKKNITLDDYSGLELSSTASWCSNFIRILPNTKYHISHVINKYAGYAFHYYGNNFNHIKGGSITTETQNNSLEDVSGTFTTPANAVYIRFRGLNTIGYDNVCLNLSHSGYRDGDYEPYEDYTLAFQDGKTISQLTGKLNGEGESVVIFPDGLRSAGNAYDEITYDESTGKHKAIKRIAAVDMGSFKWSKYEINDSKYLFSFPRPSYIKTFQSTEKANVLTIKYPTVTWNNLFNDVVNYGFAVSGEFLRLGDNSFTDAASLKASLQGQILYYELAEPEIYELDFPINTSYEAYDFGTEEVLYNDDKEVNIPMKANIEYGFNAVDMIRNNFEEIRSLKERVTALEQAILQIQTVNIAIE